MDGTDRELSIALRYRMSDAGDEIKVEEAAPEVEETSTAPKGKLSVEDALQVRFSLLYSTLAAVKIINYSIVSNSKS